MAVSRDFRQFDFSQSLCFHTLLALLPLMHVRVEPFTLALMHVETQNEPTGEIRTKAQATGAEGTVYYRYKFSCEVLAEHSCKVGVEAATAGITDIGLGQVTLRQLLITLQLALIGKLPPGTLPLFLLKPPTPPPDSPQASFETKINQAFQLCKRGQPDEALAQFLAATEFGPLSPEVHFHIGVLLMLLGHLPEAAKAFKKTLAHDHHHVLAQPYLDDVQLRLRQQPPPAEKEAVKQTPPSHASTQSIPGTGQAPGDVQARVNPDNIETLSFKLTHQSKLLIRDTAGQTKEYELTRHVTTLGRHENSDILLFSPTVSRHHAEIICVQGVCTLTDLGSANGTLYNGQPMPPNQGQRLHNGDVLKLGDVEIRYVID